MDDINQLKIDWNRIVDWKTRVIQYGEERTELYSHWRITKMNWNCCNTTSSMRFKVTLGWFISTSVYFVCAKFYEHNFLGWREINFDFLEKKIVKNPKFKKFSYGTKNLNFMVPNYLGGPGSAIQLSRLLGVHIFLTKKVAWKKECFNQKLHSFQINRIFSTLYKGICFVK